MTRQEAEVALLAIGWEWKPVDISYGTDAERCGEYGIIREPGRRRKPFYIFRAKAALNRMGWAESAPYYRTAAMAKRACILHSLNGGTWRRH